MNDGSTFTVGTDGRFVTSIPGTPGCISSGSFSIIDPMHNVLRVTATISNCSGAYAIRNGSVAYGVGILAQNTTPRRLTLAQHGSLNGTGPFIAVTTAVKQ